MSAVSVRGQMAKANRPGRYVSKMKLVWGEAEWVVAHPAPSLVWKGCKPDSVLIAIYLRDLYPRLQRRGPRLAAYLVLLPMGFSVPPTLLPAR